MTAWQQGESGITMYGPSRVMSGTKASRMESLYTTVLRTDGGGLDATRPPISSLRLWGYPVAILRRIPRIVVASVERHAFGPFTHVGYEISKRLLPMFADRDAPATVVFPCPIVGIVATRFHSAPNPIERVSAHSVRATHGTNSFTCEASATPRIPRTQFFPSYIANSATFTSAMPTSPAAHIGRRFCDYNESAETLAEQVNLVGHWEPILPGVTGRAVPAAAPLYFTGMGR